MSLNKLENGWMQFGAGKKWRCLAPRYFCEVETENNTPHYISKKTTVSKIKKIKTYYSGKVDLKQLDEFGTGVDILVANSMTESLGSVPSPLTEEELLSIYNTNMNQYHLSKIGLDSVVQYIKIKAKYLQRQEPGYTNPIDTPSRISIGAHHVLISTALSLIGVTNKSDTNNAIKELVIKLASDTFYAAHLAARYFNKAFHKHLNQPPLLAATYNAGSPRLDANNTWNLKQYGEHVDRWVAFYNTSRMS